SGGTMPPPPDIDGGDGGPPGCGGGTGFFRDVGRPLTTTGDGVQCVTIAQNRLIEKTTLEDTNAYLLELVDRAVQGQYDIIELWASEAGNTIYATGRDDSTTVVPELADVLDHPMLRDSDRPIRIWVQEAIPNKDTFASDFLSLLLEKQASTAGG